MIRRRPAEKRGNYANQRESPENTVSGVCYVHNVQSTMYIVIQAMKRKRIKNAPGKH